MTIKELIKRLEDYDEDTEVLIIGSEHGYEIAGVTDGDIDISDDGDRPIPVVFIVEGYQKYPYQGIKH